jgi:hypothetical protein
VLDTPDGGRAMAAREGALPSQASLCRLGALLARPLSSHSIATGVASRVAADVQRV